MTAPTSGASWLGTGLGTVAGQFGVEGAANRTIGSEAAADGANILFRTAVGTVSEGLPEAAQGGQER